MRKYFRIIIIILVLGLVFGLLYYWQNSRQIGGLGQNGEESVIDLFPFGGNASQNENTEEGPTETPIIESEVPQGAPALVDKKLTKIVPEGVAGYTYVLSLREKSTVTESTPNNTGSTGNIPENFEQVPAIRYVEKETGNIYDIMLDTLQTRRLSNVTIPRLHEAFFSGTNGEHVFLRYLEEDNRTINTYVAKVPEFTGAGDGESKITGNFLERGIKDFTVSPDGTKVFYTVPFGENISGVLAEKDGTKPVQLFSSVFHGWLPTFFNKNTLLLTTKASGYAEGFTYTLDTVNKKMYKILGNIGGLVSKMSPDGKYLAYSNSTVGGMNLRILTVSKNTSINTNISTIPEKCSFGGNRGYLYCGVPNFLPNSVYPDNWYQGIISFSDSLVRIDPKGEAVTTTLEDVSSLSQEQIDIVNIMVDQNDTYLIFINKSDSSLWKYNLK